MGGDDRIGAGEEVRCTGEEVKAIGKAEDCCGVDSDRGTDSCELMDGDGARKKGGGSGAIEELSSVSRARFDKVSSVAIGEPWRLSGTICGETGGVFFT